MQSASSARTLLFLAVASLAAGCARPPDVSKFDVLIVTLDTTRADRIGAFGGTAVPTPQLDAIANGGTRFTQAISTNPLTLPAHSSLFTGRYPFHHGVRHNGAYRLAASEVTLAERLRDAGFKTGAFVGAFVLDASFGLDQGFDTYSGVASSSADANFLRPSTLQRTADAVNRPFFEWLDAQKGARFFAWVHYYDAHYPYAPPESPGVQLSGTGYDREISYVDHYFGELVSHLRERGLLDRTLLVVIGDHGESLGAHGESAHGLFLYEPTLHVPFFIRAPGLVPAGKTYQSQVSLVDVAPSVLGLLGLSPTEGGDGRSLFRGPGRLAAEDRSRLVYAETWMPRVELGWSELSMLRGDRFKFIRAPRAELYNLASDPSEAVNLFDVDRGVADDLRASLDGMLDAGASATKPDSANVLSAEELAKLQSLGYLRGGTATVNDAGGSTLPDPKDHVAEAVGLEDAEQALQRGDLAVALDAFERVLQHNAHNHAALGGRARALLRQGELAKAEEAALQALASAGADPLAPRTVADNVRGLLATILSLSGRRAEAERYFRSASQASPDGIHPRSPVALLLTAAKNRDDAESIVGLATRLRPQDPWSWAARIEFCRKVGDRPGIVEAVRRIVALGPAGGPALIDVGKSAQDGGDTELALVFFEGAYRAAPNHPDVLGYLGTALLAAGKFAAAERAFEEVRRLRPGDPRVPMYLANIALMQEDEAKARRLIDEALRSAPGFIPPLLNYARWLGEKGRTPEAVAAVESALQRRPGDTDAEALLRQLRAGSPIAAGGRAP
jgi:choline-sulfatase